MKKLLVVDYECYYRQTIFKDTMRKIILMKIFKILIKMVMRHLHFFLGPKFIQILTFPLKMKYQVF
jgi:hypothetical protein